jgi:hypothetical protein
MATPVAALEEALYTTLSATSALTTELGGTAIYNKRAPQPAPDKYVIFQWQGGGDLNESPTRMRNPIYTVRGVAPTQAGASAIDDEIDAALHNQELTVTGWTNIWMAREDDVNFVEYDASGVAHYNVGGQYRIIIDS